MSVTEDALNELLIVGVDVPSIFAQHFAVLLETLSVSVELFESFAYVIDPSAGVVEKEVLLADVILPFASIVIAGI